MSYSSSLLKQDLGFNKSKNVPSNLINRCINFFKKYVVDSHLAAVKCLCYAIVFLLFFLKKSMDSQENFFKKLSAGEAIKK